MECQLKQFNSDGGDEDDNHGNINDDSRGSDF